MGDVQMIPSQVANQADPLGFDVKVGWDLDPSGRSASGLELVLDGMLHRLEQGRILMTGAPDDQVDFGEDVRAWVGEALDQSALNSRSPLIEEVLRRDPRLATVTVSLTRAMGQNASQVAFYINVSAVTIRGEQVSRVIGVSGVSVTFLAQNG